MLGRMSSGRTISSLEFRVYAAFAVFLALLAAAAYRHPVYSWDPVAYMGVVRSTQTSDARAIHSYAYAQVEAAIHTRFFDNDGAFFREMYASPEHFVEVLSFYSIRPLYVILLRDAAGAGIAPLTAARAISALSLLGIGVIALLWTRRYLGAWSAGFTALLLLWSAVLTPLREPLPDGLTGFLIVASLYAVFECECVFPGLILAALAMLVRTDAVLIFTALVIGVAVMGRLPRLHAGVLCAAAGATIWLIDRAGGHPGWAVLMHNSFVGPVWNPLEVSYTFSSRQYGEALASLFKNVVQFEIAPLACLLMSLAALLRAPARIKAAVTVALTATVARLLLYPNWEDRYFVSLCLMSGIGLAAALQRSPAFSTARVLVPESEPEQLGANLQAVGPSEH